MVKFSNFFEYVINEIFIIALRSADAKNKLKTSFSPSPVFLSFSFFDLVLAVKHYNHVSTKSSSSICHKYLIGDAIFVMHVIQGFLLECSSSVEGHNMCS